jgi:beta-lactamase regulating signal transducer with metallopeptidase domain
MWLAKPVYEFLPYSYVAVGVAAIVAAVYVQSWYWAEACLAVGAAGVVVGLALLLKRRDYRSSRSRTDFEKTR